jgi:PAS domain S-box-containing protein
MEFSARGGSFIFKSIRYQLIFMVSLLVILALGVAMTVSYYLISTDFEGHIEQTNAVMAESLASNIRQFMTNAYNISADLAKNPDVIGFNPSKQQAAVMDTVTQHPFFQLVITHKLNGDQTARSSGPLTNRVDRWWFQKFMAEKKPYIGASYYSVFSNTAVTTMVHGIYDGDELVGLVMANIQTTTLQPMVEKYNSGAGNYAYLLDGDGMVVVHPDKQQIVELYNYKTQKKVSLKKDAQGHIVRDVNGNEVTEEVDFKVPVKLKAIIDKVMKGETGIGEYTDFDGNDYVCAYRSIPLPGNSSPWNLIMVQKKSTAFAFLRDVAAKSLVIVFLVLLIAIILTYWFANRITKPLITIAGATERIAAGELDVIVERHGTRDEIGALEKSIQCMVDNLQQMMGDLESKNSLLAKEVRERKQIQATLAISEEKYSKAFRYAADVIGLVNLKTEKYIEVSEAFFRVFGYSREEVIGARSAELGLWYVAEERSKIFEMLRDGLSVRNYEVCWRTKGGAQRLGLFSLEEIDIGGQCHLLHVWHDITEAKQAEEALIKANDDLEIKVKVRTQELTVANKELQTMNQAVSHTLQELQHTQQQLIQSGKMASLGGLVAGVAHEINTPIGVSVTAASYFAGLSKKISRMYHEGDLAREDLEDYLVQTEQSMSILTANLERAADLINSFKKVSVDQSSERKRLFSVAEYLGEIILTLHPKFKNTHIKIGVEGDEQLEIYGYAGAFAQIITNLLDNSLVHAYEKHNQTGRIGISFNAVGQDFHLIYTDDGKGMSHETITHIFDPFFTTNRGQGGTGLGMHIVYNIVTRNFDGMIECSSVQGQGTTFKIIFPFKQEVGV